MIKVNGVKFDLDTMDIEVSEKIEEQLTLVPKMMNIKPKTRVEGLKQIYNAVSNCFDEVLGEGSAEKIFKGKKNCKLCLDCFEQFVNEIERSDREVGNELKKVADKYSSNRAERRNNKKDFVPKNKRHR